jgi:hypothetical protein
MTTSSAVPGWLLRYGDEATAMDDELAAKATTAADALRTFAATWPDVGYPPHDPADDARDHALRNREVDAWVHRIGEAFRRADLANGGGWFCSIPVKPTVVDDELLDAAGYATDEEAAQAANRFADTLADRIHHHYGDIDEHDVERWRDTMRTHQHDAAYAAALYNRLGATGALWIVKTIEDHYPGGELGDPRWGLDALRPFSEALATAMTTRNDDHVRAPVRLHERFVDDIVEPPTSWDGRQPEEYHLGLLVREGRFPTDVLVRLARNVVDPHLASTFRASPFAINAWGPADDPVANVLGAVAKDPDASLDYLGDATTLRAFLERWANDLDGDGGRNAAAVLQAALTNTSTGRNDQSTAVLDDAIRVTAELGEIRNWFDHAALAAGTAAHIDHVAAIAKTEGDPRLVDTYEFLTTLLEDPDAALDMYDASVRHVYDTVGQAPPGDTLGSEMWDAGSLFALVFAADAKAKVDDAKDRIARRQALLDGLTEITDLALTFTGGRWVPFAKTGRDAIVDSFRNDDELDQALARIGTFEAGLRLRLSVVIAVRMAQDGKLPPPPGGLPTGGTITVADVARLDAWVGSDAVRDIIGPDRSETGQRMDELVHILDEPDD